MIVEALVRPTPGGLTCSSTTAGFAANTGQLLEEKVNVAAGAQSATFGAGTPDHVLLGLVAF
jgi:hypothetical protein